MGWFSREAEWVSPVGDPENLDIINKRPDGIIDLLVVVARPLDATKKTIDVLSQKFQNYCLYVKTDAFAQEFGSPENVHVRIGLFSPWEVPQELIAIVSKIADEQNVPAELALFHEYPPPGDIGYSDPGSPPPPIQVSDLWPYVVPRSYFDDISNEVFVNSEMVEMGIVQPVCGELFRMVANCSQNLIRNVQAKDLAILGMDVAAAKRAAENNLIRLAKDDQTIAKHLSETPTGVPFATWAGNWLTASCILLPDLYSWAREHLKSDEILVSIPQIQFMVLFPRGDAAFRGAMRQYCMQLVEGMDKLVTFDLFELGESVLTQFVE